GWPVPTFLDARVVPPRRDIAARHRALRYAPPARCERERYPKGPSSALPACRHRLTCPGRARTFSKFPAPRSPRWPPVPVPAPDTDRAPCAGADPKRLASEQGLFPVEDALPPLRSPNG